MLIKKKKFRCTLAIVFTLDSIRFCFCNDRWIIYCIVIISSIDDAIHMLKYTCKFWNVQATNFNLAINSCWLLVFARWWTTQNLKYKVRKRVIQSPNGSGLVATFGQTFFIVESNLQLFFSTLKSNVLTIYLIKITFVTLEHLKCLIERSCAVKLSKWYSIFSLYYYLKNMLVTAQL